MSVKTPWPTHKAKARASRRHTAVRLPWVKKEANDKNV